MWVFWKTNFASCLFFVNAMYSFKLRFALWTFVNVPRHLLVLCIFLAWVLHLGYCWLIIGLLCFALYAFDVIALSTGFHALTAGAIGTMTLGMMARVALGHTGRELKASPTTTCAFVLMQAAIVLRVFVPMIDASYSIWAIPISAYMWAGCFALYLCVYSPALWQARPDGRPA